MRFMTLISTVLLGSIAWSGALAVEKPPYKRAMPVEQGPIYDPKTGSYFELRLLRGTNVPYWHLARDRAASLSHQGRRGRLAVVRDTDTLTFIRERFRFNEEAWIGLQFFCRFRQLMWVSGEHQPLNSPGMWAAQWYRDPNVLCTNQRISYMPVYLTEEGRSNVYWQASGPSKGFRSFLVEYPAPPAEAKETGSGGAAETQ